MGGGGYFFWLGASADADPALVASDQAASRLARTGFDPLRIAASLSAAERKAMMHREGGSEACMSSGVARSLYDRGLTLRNARFLRLTWLGASVRAALQAIEA